MSDVSDLGEGGGGGGRWGEVDNSARGVGIPITGLISRLVPMLELACF